MAGSDADMAGFVEPGARKRQRRGATIQLGRAVWGLLRNLGIDRRIREEMAVQLWPEAVGEPIASRATASRIENGRLFVEVESAAWRNELLFMKKDIIGLLNKRVASTVVKDIVFVARST